MPITTREDTIAPCPALPRDLDPILAFSGVMLVLFNRHTRVATDKAWWKRLAPSRSRGRPLDCVSGTLHFLQGKGWTRDVRARPDLRRRRRRARAVSTKPWSVATRVCRLNKTSINAREGEVGISPRKRAGQVRSYPATGCLSASKVHYRRQLKAREKPPLARVLP